MARRKFNADLASTANMALPLVSKVKKGDDDGQVDFTYTHQALPAPVLVRLLTMDIDGYPDHPGFLAFTSNDQVPPGLSKVLQECPEFTENKKISDACRILSRKITASLEADGDLTMTESSSEPRSDDVCEEFQDDSDHQMDMDSDDDILEFLGALDENGDVEYDLKDFDFDPMDRRDNFPESQEAQMSPRLIADLRVAQSVGFRIGILSNSQQILSLSIPAQSLGLQSEILTAWGVESSDYLVLLLKIHGVYTPAEIFIDKSSPTTLFRFGKCADYKPTASSALQAFELKPTRYESLVGGSGHKVSNNETGSSFQKLLVSNSMDWWINKDFASLLKLRLGYGLSWDEGIEQLIELAAHTQHVDRQGMITTKLDQEDTAAIVAATALKCLNIDFVLHDASGRRITDDSPRSLPLIAAQFALRYFAQSTHYCMVCHCKSQDEFEAMKPYVCTKPLCLFQYMSLGFGESIEHEIIAQPLVVDLLVGFCYVALTSGRLREYPKGLGVNVPVVPRPLTAAYARRDPQPLVQLSGQPSILAGGSPAQTPDTPFVAAVVNLFMATLLVETQHISALRPGSWFVLKTGSQLLHDRSFQEDLTLHCKVVRTDITADSSRTQVTYKCSSIQKTGISMRLDADRLTLSPVNPGDNTRNIPWPKNEIKAELYTYNQNIDGLQSVELRQALLSLLDSLPSVLEMHEELTKGGASSLANCQRISVPALAFLKWIVSSNRSLIMQVDCPNEFQGSDAIAALNRPDERVDGVGKCIQFKFAQGSPDKEHRFLSAVKDHAAKNTAAPTIFAWHGSQIGNWHSIIREGLDYNDTVNGRAFGNGVYFSNEYNTSASYATAAGSQWPNSLLKISNAISLCEIVNRPDRFVSQSPHYVVADVDWIQCRYLLVSRLVQYGEANLLPTHVNMSDIQDYMKQDELYRPTGPSGKRVEIPSTALPRSRPASGYGESKPTVSELRITPGHNFEDDLDQFLAAKERDGDDDETVDVVAMFDRTKTDFRPGTLNLATLPKLPSPTWADDNGRKILGRELRKMQKVQSSVSLHELGWYMDFENTDNLFHWIVELHSFDPSLPVAKDMKSHKVSSIVLEIRFGRQFPMSPPFVRIIRPRFLPFAEGGGGHVTAGGAMCMELLTNTGWSPANSIESVILQVRMAICNLEPTPARLERGAYASSDYGIAEAIQAYKRVALRHGWQVPPDIEQTAQGI